MALRPTEHLPSTKQRDFDTLARAHKDAVYRQMVRLCGNAEDAEDVLVEALLKAYRALPSLQQPEAFQAWLAIIARRACTRLKRREALLPLLSLSDLTLPHQEPPSPAPPPEERILEEETRDCIYSALATLPPAYRMVYELREMQDLTAPEVAERLGISVAAVKSRLHRARALMREKLDQSLTP